MIIKLKDCPDGLSGIYKINFPNGKSYIGMSNSIKRRISEHNHSKQRNILYKVINKYGKITEFELLERISNNNRDYMEERERHYISFYKTLITENGYNILKGGDSSNQIGVDNFNSKISEDELIKIKQFLAEDKMTIKQIAEYFSVSVKVIENINLGNTYVVKNQEYPIRKKKVITTKLSKEEIQEVIFLLINTNVTQKEIAKNFQVTEEIIRKINKGEGLYYVEENSYPIRNKNTNRRKFSAEQIDLIILDLSNSILTQIEIAKKFNCARKLIGQINKGEKYFNKKYSYPIR